MNFQIFSGVVQELACLVTGARVERVFQGSGGGIYLILAVKSRRRILLLSPNRALPRLHLVSVKPSADEAPQGFPLYLRSHLAGARLVHIALLNQDRIAEFRFNREGKKYRLICELFGTAANLILTDDLLKILAVSYPLPPSDRKTRALLPGMEYVVPEKKQSGAPEEVPGVSQTDAPASPNRAAEQYYEGLIERQGIAALRAGLSAALNKSLAKNRRLVKALSDDRQSAEKIDEYRRTGELVLASLSRLKTGMEQAELTGYDGETVTVRLDPKRSPAGNAEAYFKKYKKAKAGIGIIETRLRQAEEEKRYLQSLVTVLEQAGDYNSLDRLRKELAAGGYGASGKAAGKTRTPSVNQPFKKVIAEGWEILVGKNAAGNDYLTTRIARPDDLWLHAEGLPGSHVLVRNPENRDIPPAVFLKAAALAAFYSKGKTSGKVSVTYTRAAMVRKPKGAKPGLVTLAERRSVMVKPEDA